MIIRVKKNSNYTVMSNRHLRESGMSLKAKGLMSQMLSMPDGWRFSVKGLQTMSRDGRDSIIAALRELERFGYLTRTKSHGESGKFSGCEYEIRESPFTENPYTEKPNTENPNLINKDVGDKDNVGDEYLNDESINRKESKEIMEIKKRWHRLTLSLIVNNWTKSDEMADRIDWSIRRCIRQIGLENTRNIIEDLNRMGFEKESIRNKEGYIKEALERWNR